VRTKYEYRVSSIAPLPAMATLSQRRAAPTAMTAALPSDADLTGAIVGAMLGGLATICLVLFVVFFIIRRRTQPRDGGVRSAASISPGQEHGPTWASGTMYSSAGLPQMTEQPIQLEQWTNTSGTEVKARRVDPVWRTREIEADEGTAAATPAASLAMQSLGRNHRASRIENHKSGHIPAATEATALLQAKKKKSTFQVGLCSHHECPLNSLTVVKSNENVTSRDTWAAARRMVMAWESKETRLAGWRRLAALMPTLSPFEADISSFYFAAPDIDNIDDHFATLAAYLQYRTIDRVAAWHICFALTEWILPEARSGQPQVFASTLAWMSSTLAWVLSWRMYSFLYQSSWATTSRSYFCRIDLVKRPSHIPKDRVGDIISTLVSVFGHASTEANSQEKSLDLINAILHQAEPQPLAVAALIQMVPRIRLRESIALSCGCLALHVFSEKAQEDSFRQKLVLSFPSIDAIVDTLHYLTQADQDGVRSTRLWVNIQSAAKTALEFERHATPSRGLSTTATLKLLDAVAFSIKEAIVCTSSEGVPGRSKSRRRTEQLALEGKIPGTASRRVLENIEDIFSLLETLGTGPPIGIASQNRMLYGLFLGQLLATTPQDPSRLRWLETWLGEASRLSPEERLVKLGYQPSTFSNLLGCLTWKPSARSLFFGFCLVVDFLARGLRLYAYRLKRCRLRSLSAAKALLQSITNSSQVAMLMNAMNLGAKPGRRRVTWTCVSTPSSFLSVLPRVL